MKVSAIIPAYNEEKYIKKCIDSLLKQTYGGLEEIIVVDDGSTDKTREIVSKYDGPVRLMTQNHEGPGRARNRAAAGAAGDILVFIDGDMYLDPEAVEKLVRPIIEGKTKGTFLIEEKVANPGNYWSRMWSIAHNLPYEWRFSEKDRKNLEYIDVFRAIKRDVFIESGGNLEERATGQDKIAERVGEKALSVKGAIAYHYNVDSFRRFFKDAVKFGKGRIHTHKTFHKKIALVFKYSVFRSVPAGIYKSIKRKAFSFVFFKILLDFFILCGFIYASFTRDNKE